MVLFRELVAVHSEEFVVVHSEELVVVYFEESFAVQIHAPVLFFLLQVCFLG